MPLNLSATDRLLRRVRIDPFGCWLWTGAKKPSGYGNVQIDRIFMGAHVASYVTFIGPVPDGHHVCHTCDKPSCINPAHLFAGTPSDNMRDCIRKGRKPKRGPDKRKRKPRTKRGAI